MKLASLFLFVFFLGCGEPSNNSEKFLPLDKNNSAYRVSEKSVYADESVNSEAISPKDQKIIKTASLVFESQDLEKTHQGIIGLVGAYGGIIQNDNIGKGHNRVYRNITTRIPVEYFQAFIDSVSIGVAYFDRRDITQKDVTEEFVDIEARLKAKRSLESRYLELLTKAKNVKEMLEIERELSNIREEIEARQGRLQYLENRVMMSTITIEFYKLTAESGITQSYGQKMINALKGGWNGISVFVLGLLYLWPFFLMAFIITLVVRRYLKKKALKR